MLTALHDPLTQPLNIDTPADVLPDCEGTTAWLQQVKHLLPGSSDNQHMHTLSNSSSCCRLGCVAAATSSTGRRRQLCTAQQTAAGSSLVNLQHAAAHKPFVAALLSSALCGC